MSVLSKAALILSNVAHSGGNNIRVVHVRCSDSSRRGFSSQDGQDPKQKRSTREQKAKLPRQRKRTGGQSSPFPDQYESSKLSKSYGVQSDFEFEEKLKAIRRSAVEQKKTEIEKEFGAIDYDTSSEPKQRAVGFGTKVGVGVAVLVFGLVFALGDFLPSGSVSSSTDEKVDAPKLSKEETDTLEARLKQFEETLASSPGDPVALEGAAVSLVELGEYSKASILLENLLKEKPNDPDVYRLLGEVKYELKDFEASAAAYKTSLKTSSPVDFEVLRGLTDALLAAKKPDEAVQVLSEAQSYLNVEQVNEGTTTERSTMNEKQVKTDPIQVELLLGKAYSAWGHISDAVSVYDHVISSYPNDFRGYLAKGILLKGNGNLGDAERMFIQARFFAPEKAKTLVDRFSRR